MALTRFFMMSILVLAGAGEIAAEHCTGPSTTEAEVDVAADLYRYYIDFDHLPTLPTPEYVPAVWLYEEANSLPGLQRGDQAVDNTCHGMIAPDRLL